MRAGMLVLLLSTSLSFAVDTAGRQPPPGAAPQTAAPAEPEFGPARGTLMIIGGGVKSEAILKQFVGLAGGPDASILLVPTAADGDGPVYYREDLQDLQAAGARNVKILHTRDRSVADSAAFVAPIETASGVFLAGGRQWRLADAYLNTRTQAALRRLLDRGGVIAGTSAGATIQGSFMVRGDTKGNELMIGDHVEGLGFLKGVTIDQHLLRRNRQFDLIPVIESASRTARHRPRRRHRDCGASRPVRGDGQRLRPWSTTTSGWSDHRGRFYLLAPGDRYNLKTREAERPQMKMGPVERVVKQPWK